MSDETQAVAVAALARLSRELRRAAFLEAAAKWADPDREHGVTPYEFLVSLADAERLDFDGVSS